MKNCFHGEVILPDQTIRDAFVVCDSDCIVEIGSTRPSDVAVVEGAYIAPGYIDMHVHGGDGSDYMDGDTEAVRAANRAHARHGTTSIFPTTTTGTPAEIESMLDACSEVRDNWSIADGSSIAGVHYYGPYFAADKVGCHSVDGRRDPVAAEYERFLSLGLIRIATCAAELPGAEEFTLSPAGTDAS